MAHYIKLCKLRTFHQKPSKAKYCFYRNNERHLIENYDKAASDHFRGWHIHHRLELTISGEPALSKADLIRMNMYYRRPYFELIYLPAPVHCSLHNAKPYRIKYLVNKYHI